MRALLPDGLPEISASTREVIELLLRDGPTGRSALARRLTLSPAALTKLARPMVELGLFSELEPQVKGHTGRPSQPLSINPGLVEFAGIKLTADRAFGVRTDLAGTVLAAVERPLRTSRVEDVFNDIVAVVNVLGGPSGLSGLGVGLAGRVARSRGMVISSPFLGWSEVALAEYLADRLRLPVVVENDLRALTAARHWFSEGLRSFTLVTVGAGLGCGLVIDDRLVEGSSGAAGLIDHLQIDDRGPACALGHRGCASGYATTAGILQAMSDRVGERLGSLDDVAALARAGDRAAAGVLADAGYAVGHVIGVVCNIAGPSAVILSGEGVDVYDTLRDALAAGMRATIHPSLPPITLIVTPMAFTEWARGAAVVAIQQHLDRRSGRVTGRAA